MSNSDLRQRAVDCSCWRWMQGMLATDSVAVAHRIYSDGRSLYAISNIPDASPIKILQDKNQDFLPVLSDPATDGCLMHLVAQSNRVSIEDLTLKKVSGGWCVWINYSKNSSKLMSINEESRTEALVVALESSTLES